MMPLHILPTGKFIDGIKLIFDILEIELVYLAMFLRLMYLANLLPSYTTCFYKDISTDVPPNTAS